MNPVASMIFGGVACRVRSDQHIGEAPTIACNRHQPDTAAATKQQAFPIDAEIFNTLTHGIHSQCRIIESRITQKYTEFVTAQARDGIAFAYLVSELRRDLTQQFVASGMAATVVDNLELIQVHVAQRMGGIVQSRLLQQVAQTILECSAI